MGGADAHDVLYVGGLLREHHRVRRLRWQPGRGMGVLLAYGLGGDEAIAKPRGKLFDHGGNRPGLCTLRIIGNRHCQENFLPRVTVAKDIWRVKGLAEWTP